VGETFAADAEKRAFLVQRLEHRALAPERPERLAAVVALDLPLDLLVTSRWLDAAIADEHPHARRRVVPLGRPEIASVEPSSGPLHVGGAPGELLALCEEPVEAADSEFDVWVALDEPLVEDLGVPSAPASPLTPLLAAFARGATCVAVPTEGRDEVVAHRENGLLTDPDDLLGTARALDELARDRELLARLRAGALETARRWPAWADAGAALLDALDDLPTSTYAPWAGAIMADATAEAVKLSAYESARMDEMHAWAARIEERERAVAEPPPPLTQRLRARLRRS
jgi:hypothetical protein